MNRVNTGIVNKNRIYLFVQHEKAKLMVYMFVNVNVNFNKLSREKGVRIVTPIT